MNGSGLGTWSRVSLGPVSTEEAVVSEAGPGRQVFPSQEETVQTLTHVLGAPVSPTVLSHGDAGLYTH